MKEPSFTIVIKDNKKYIYCNAECIHLEYGSNTYRCELYDKDLEFCTESCKECIEYLNSLGDYINVK